MLNTSEKNLRLYNVADCCCFAKASDQWGAFSNMGMKFPFMLEGVLVKSSEYLYQALKFQHSFKMQKQIMEATNALEAKSIAYTNVEEMDGEKNKIMRYCLFMKYLAYKDYFDDLFIRTRKKNIVEISLKDGYWGAKKEKPGMLSGVNALGRLWMEIRELGESLMDREDSFVLYGKSFNYKSKVEKVTINEQTSFL